VERRHALGLRAPWELEPEEISLRKLVLGFDRIGVEPTPEVVHNLAAMVELWPAVSASGERVPDPELGEHP
jgi:hypothetical protein